ncbi:GNAT family N-acetyltransferase [Mangrovimonas sp. ST2L15]|uniref:GNAT family N-acetyltransferase n=1 Tax=Mangrovimonas sp. ST2L15 TaxID=1645916 RepID=UPI0006B4157C|nr:GNAT family N-acetyltransferase [Mangrovimonas sp. ST2L15]
MTTYKLYNSFKDLPEAWSVLSKNDLFLQESYLKAMELASPNNISWYYVGVFKEQRLVGIAIIQRIELYLRDMFRERTDGFFLRSLKNILSIVLRGNMLVVGNMTHTGQHSLYHTKEISKDDFCDAIIRALNDLRLKIKMENHKKIRVILWKDYFSDQVPFGNSRVYTKEQLNRVEVQPNMILKVKDHWKTFDDYLTDLNKKYLRRYRTALKKAKNIRKEELDIEQVRTLSDTIYQYYKTVSDNASFNTFILPKNHFISLKSELKDAFKVYGYFLDNELIGFYTLLINKSQLETYFLGYHPNYQYTYQLYLNMLYDMAAYGINQGFQNVVYARTAMEIKSSVGAEALPMVVFMKHTNLLLNALFRQIFKLMNPTKKWEERHPFKH